MYRPPVEEPSPPTSHGVCGNWALLFTTVSLLFLSVLVWLALVQTILTKHHLHLEHEYHASNHHTLHFNQEDVKVHARSESQDADETIYDGPVIFSPDNHQDEEEDIPILESSSINTSTTTTTTTTVLLPKPDANPVITAVDDYVTHSFSTEVVKSPNIVLTTELSIPQNIVVETSSTAAPEQSSPEIWCHLSRKDNVLDSYLLHVRDYCTHVLFDDEISFTSDDVVFEAGDLGRYRRHIPNAKFILGTQQMHESILHTGNRESLFTSLISTLARARVHGVAVHEFDVSTTGIPSSVVRAKFRDFYVSLAEKLHSNRFIHAFIIRHSVNRYKEYNVSSLLDDRYTPLIILSHSLFPPSNSLCTSPYRWKNKRTMTQVRVLKEIREHLGRGWKRHTLLTTAPVVTSCIVRNSTVLSRCKLRYYSQFCTEVNKGNLIPNTTLYGNETNCFSAQTRQDANSPLYLWTGTGPYSMNFVQNLTLTRGVVFFNLTADDRETHCGTRPFPILANIHAVFNHIDIV